MPTYEYECGSCGHRFEEIQSMTAPKLLECPECRMPDLQRLPGIGVLGFFREPLALESYGAPNDAVRREQEQKYGMEFDSENRAIVRDNRELTRIKKIFGDAT